MLKYAVALLLLLPSVAHADAIDGSWCGEHGGHISIDGPTLVIVGKSPIVGHYRRHDFSYVVPAGEADAGKLVYMQLLDEEDMQSFVMEDGKPGAQENWKRCAVTS
ncbi:MAG: hypothetical protein ABIN69_10690 [Aestuariivirga sp.]